MQTINKLKEEFYNIINIIEKSNSYKILQYLKQIPLLCYLNNLSIENRKLRQLDENKLHPKGVGRGEIYNLKITEGVGSELSDNHLVIIIQNKKGNMYSEKVNIIPIEGDGKSINPNYQMQLNNADLIEGMLDKNPSRIILTDIMTYDKARLGTKIGKINQDKMKAINIKLKKQLELE